jgi:signal transduction histidine kinase
MNKLLRRYFDNAALGTTALLILFGLAYLEIFVQAAPVLSLLDIVLLMVLGLVYLVLFTEGLSYTIKHPQTLVYVVFFSSSILVVEAIEWFSLTLGGFWLLFLPIVATAVSILPRTFWLLVCGIVSMAFAIPLLLQGHNLSGISGNTLSFMTGVVFVAVFSQIAENERKARSALDVANKKLREYASQAEELATTKERNRMAREIHDSLGHYLTVINVQIGAAKAVLATDTSRALAALDKAQNLTREGLTEVRHSVASLRTSPVENRPLSEALNDLVTENRAAGIVTELVIEGTPPQLSPQLNLTLYRAVQEGLTNVRKHACASRVDLTLKYAPDKLYLTIADNGTGKVGSSVGFGLLGLRERVQLLAGTLQEKSNFGQGFTLELELPV